MNRAEFMKKLNALLSDVSPEEREEALQYYNDYFDDAGPEQEARILAELGSPEQVAWKIKASLSGDDSTPRPSNPPSGKKERNLWKLLAIILLCILLAPFVIPVGVGVLAVLLSVIIAVVATVAAILVSGIVIFIAGIFVIGVGLVQLFTFPALGIATAGAGCLLTSLGILLSLALLWIALKVVPVVVQGIVNLIRLPFRKAGVIQ